MQRIDLNCSIVINQFEPKYWHV